MKGDPETEEEAVSRIKAKVKKWPPLSPGQRERLAALFAVTNR